VATTTKTASPPKIPTTTQTATSGPQGY
jgi:hypothetical protein